MDRMFFSTGWGLSFPRVFLERACTRLWCPYFKNPKKLIFKKFKKISHISKIKKNLIFQKIQKNLIFQKFKKIPYSKSQKNLILSKNSKKSKKLKIHRSLFLGLFQNHFHSRGMSQHFKKNFTLGARPHVFKVISF